MTSPAGFGDDRKQSNAKDQEALVDSDDTTTRPTCSRRRRPPLLFILLVLSAAGFLLLPGGLRARCGKKQTAAATRQGVSTALVPRADHVPLDSAALMQNSPGYGQHLPPRPTTGIHGLLSRARDITTGMVVQARQNLFPPPGGRRQVLQCFQVSQPVLMPTKRSDGIDGPGEPCQMVLMDHVFAFSYNDPFIGDYTPPSCDFNRVVMNFSVVSAGRQFDRLAVMYLNDTEVWRTSTAEPVASPGIHWEYSIDMTPYLSMWKKPQNLIFDLGNLVNDRYNGTYNTTLTATFFMDNVSTMTSPPADLIIPISGLNNSQDSNPPVSVFVLPDHNASTTVKSFPRNANRAVLSVIANGQASEEFWWSNLLQTDVETFNATTGNSPGLSPFREVQAMIDGRLAGVQWPFPVIFTGGVVPAFHRPLVGLQAFNIREHEIDITPWLPLLCDGNPHTFSFTVVGLDDDEGASATLTNDTNQSWYVSGKIFVWLDDEGSITTGSAPEVNSTDPSISLSRDLGEDQRGRNRTLDFSVLVQRSYSVAATVKTQHSTTFSAWRQLLSFETTNNVSAYGQNQNVVFGIRGSDTAFADSKAVYGQDYSYPLSVNMQTRQAPSGAMTIQASMYQGMTFQTAGRAVFPHGLEAFAGTRDAKNFSASVLSTFRDGTATLQQSADGRTSTGTGNIRQEFAFGGNFLRYPDITESSGVGPQPDVMLYYRNVTVTNGAVTRDRESIADRRSRSGVVGSESVADEQQERGGKGVLAMSQQVVFSPSGDGEFAPARFSRQAAVEDGVLEVDV